MRSKLRGLCLALGFLIVSFLGGRVAHAQLAHLIKDLNTQPSPIGRIEQLAADGITSGCGGGNYCPDQPITRGEMAVFLATAFHLPLP